jgi:hypothetical protein
VPTETDVPTVQVRLVVPREFDIEMIEHSQVWQITTVRDERGHVREITWNGSRIPPQTFEELKILARNPATPGTYVWKIEQHYERGDFATWEAQTQISTPESTGAQRAEEAWRAAQVATTVSLIAIGMSVILIIVTIVNIIQTGRQHTGGVP